MTGHPADDVLHDYVDTALPADVERDVSRHVDACAPCGAHVARLMALRAAAAALPRVVEPREDPWPAIRRRIDQRKVVSLPAGARRVHRRWGVVASLAAAAVVLVVVSSAVTTVALRRPAASDPVRVELAPGGAVRGQLPGRFAALEADYIRAADELSATLEARRSELSPETIATVERSLRVIDEAILEARAALARDPANPDLAQMLSATYRQKLDLLRRTAELPVRT